MAPRPKRKSGSAWLAMRRFGGFLESGSPGMVLSSDTPPGTDGLCQRRNKRGESRKRTRPFVCFSLALALTAPPTASNGTPLPRPPASFRGPSSELLRVCESASLRVCESASLRRCAFRGSLVGGEQPPAMSETLKAAQALHVPALTSTTRPVTDAARQPLLLSSWPPHTAPLDIPTPHSPLLSSRWEVEVNTRRRLLLFLVPNLQHPESLSLPALPCSARQCPSLQTLLATTHSPAGSSNSSNSSSTSVTVPIHSPPSAVHLRHGWPQLPQSSAHPFRPPKAAARVGRHAPPSQSARHTFSTSWQAGSPSLHRSSRTLLIPWGAVAIRPRLHAEVAASKKDLPHVSERNSGYPLRRRTTGCSGCLTALASTKQRPCAGLCFFGLCSQRERASLVPSTLELLDVFARRATEILAYCSNYRPSQLAARDFVDGTASLHLLHHR
ncbi:hypothetical protein L207DRAFT_530048 [Hyaloscypha variabilis F]|uniref:Uncharacterized protein n=1 Tax=Hyaloscypha variabilis (strain UAMH 11265 / GT02V1 / F) TaxID=1149755 RepID=A0A2J6RNP8_HYAVF|nr:hypothetical protein L207DRAFT_530048 [Hyaloscypha variabilis F]